MIVRNGMDMGPSPETDDDRARVSIKKGFLTFGCMAAAVLCGLSFYDYRKGADARDAEAQAVIDMTDGIEIPVWKVPSGGLGTDIVADMTVAGMDVAALQNKYFGDEDMLDVQSELKAYFMDSSGELRWFSPGSNFNGASWHYETGSGIESAGESGMWLCRDDGGNLCAYVTAKYDRDSGKFMDAECHVTTDGLAQSMAVDIPEAGLCEDDDYDEYYDFINDPEGRFTNSGEVGADVTEQGQ